MTDSPNAQPTGPDTIALERTRYHDELRQGIGSGHATALVPRSFAEAQSFAGALAASDLIPSALRGRAPDVLMIVLAGAEVGFSPVTALRMFYVNPKTGTASLMAGGKAALVRAGGACEYLRPDAANSTTKATWHTKRRGEDPVSYTYTIEQAQQAGLTGKDNWKSYPARMLSARARSWLCDDVYPDFVAGMREQDDDDHDFDSGPPKFVAPPSAPNLSVVPPPGDKPKTTRASKPKTDATDVIDAEHTEVKEPTEAQKKTAREIEAREEAFRKAREGSQAANPPTADPAPSTTTEPSAPAAMVADDGFGDESEAGGPTRTQLEMIDGKPVCRALDGHDAKANFAKFTAELARIQVGTGAADALDRVKREWIPWSKQGSAGADFGQAMREAFTKRKQELGV